MEANVTVSTGTITHIGTTVRESVLRGFRARERETLVDRIASLLDYTRRHAPGEFLPYALAAKIVFMLGSKPRETSTEVLAVRRKMTRVRTVMFQQYKCAVVSQAGVGIRALVDDGDHLMNDVRSRAVRLDRERARFVRSARLVDLRKVPDEPRFASTKAWAKKELASVLKQLGTALESRLALPPIGGTSPEKK